MRASGLFLVTGILVLIMAGSVQAQSVRPLRILCIGAHPDDCDVKMGGTAALYAAMGHQVKFLSVTNGDAGHYAQGGGVLANRRRAEAEEAARRLGIAEYEVLDNHDAELVPSLEVRKQIIRKIREWQADLVFAPRPNDYHPDHRYTGQLVQDAAYLVMVPNVVPDTPPLAHNPVFLYLSDRFKKPNPFSPDIAVIIDSVVERKLDALDAHVSQFYEWLPWIDGRLAEVPADSAARREWLRAQWLRPNITQEVRLALMRWYDPEVATQAQHVEAFEICEYGHQPTEDEIRLLFPMLGKQ
ncbi:PIG-L deacetylase family protein [Rhodothermus marinus]|uniref:LmbE family protein n=1 Tax=Rhodothermus marinus (strain ATCC 43812 / DSM 4252 / R-10) TaxID=518766 RepID=D0MHZ9_RHOM4|nr:LmbE family protein [Rhodothermus marinus DSM 4252]